jgi:GntR family transcriptional regulator
MQWYSPLVTEPLWAQTAERLLAEIATLGPGGRLPAERDLCRDLGVSRVTLRRALGHLIDLGAVTAAHGRGWFVAAAPPTRDWPNDLESFTATARRKGLNAHSRVVRLEQRPATLDEAERLLLPAGTPLLGLDRVRFLDDIAVALDRTIMAQRAAGDLGDVDFTTASLFATLAERGVRLGRADVTIEARPATAETARLLSIAEGTPTLFLDQTIHTPDGRPLLLSSVEYAGERYRLRTVFMPAVR